MPATAGKDGEKMTGGKAPRQAGDRYERELVKAHRDIGIPAERVVCSGSHLAQPYDVDIYAFGRDEAPLVAEAKRRNVPKTITDWLGDNDLLFIRPKGESFVTAPETIVVMPWSTYARLLKK